MATAVERRSFLSEHVSADLAYLWDDAGVDEAYQYATAQHYKTVRRFSSLGDDRITLRAAITSNFGLDPAAGAIQRSQMAARDFIETDNRLKAEARVLGTPRALSSSDKTAMRIGTRGWRIAGFSSR